MKIRRMCGGGVRSTGIRELRAVTSGSGAWALIHDRTGTALVLRDPANDWPRTPWPVVRRRWRWRAQDAALEARHRLMDRVCAVLGHRPDPVESWCCSRCRGASGVDS